MEWNINRLCDCEDKKWTIQQENVNNKSEELVRGNVMDIERDRLKAGIVTWSKKRTI
jgi:hypothetical protein